jgi:hypothetical protein
MPASRPEQAPPADTRPLALGRKRTRGVLLSAHCRAHHRAPALAKDGRESATSTWPKARPFSSVAWVRTSAKLGCGVRLLYGAVNPCRPVLPGEPCWAGGASPRPSRGCSMLFAAVRVGR